MKSKTVKLIFTALAFCLLISILAMGALATGDGTAEPTNSDTSSTPEPQEVTVSFTVAGYENASITAYDDGARVSELVITRGVGSFKVVSGSSVSITVTPKDGYKVTCSSGWMFNGTTNTATAAVTGDTSVSFTVTEKAKPQWRSLRGPDCYGNRMA